MISITLFFFYFGISILGLGLFIKLLIDPIGFLFIAIPSGLLFLGIRWVFFVKLPKLENKRIEELKKIASDYKLEFKLFNDSFSIKKFQLFEKATAKSFQSGKNPLFSNFLIGKWNSKNISQYIFSYAVGVWSGENNPMDPYFCLEIETNLQSLNNEHIKKYFKENALNGGVELFENTFIYYIKSKNVKPKDFPLIFNKITNLVKILEN